MKNYLFILLSVVAIEAIGQTKDNLKDTIVTGIEDDYDKSISIYPNPSNSSVTVNGDFDEAIVLNMNMERVAVISRTITVNDFNPGFYIVRIRKDKLVTNKKLIIGNSQ